MEKPQVRNRFKTPEGRYFLQSEKTTGLVPFNSGRCTRLSYASFSGGPEDGSWLVYNVGDYLHLTRPDSIDKEPARSLLFSSSSVRSGFPTCHAWYPAKDGLDLVVGLGDGEAVVLSLRAQIQAPASAGKPIVASTHSPDGSPESIRCTAVAWLPRSEGTFLVAYSTGVIQLFKKGGSTSSDGSKFSLGISSKNEKQQTVFSPGGGPISDIAVSPDGSRLAVACRDGVCRLMDTASGSVVGGFQTYYGSVLCCCWSPDGRYIACGGEDDLVAVYGLAEKYCVQFGEGHCSWVSRVAFDPWQPLSNVTAPVADLANGKIYRLASVGQDTQLCLWDLSLFQDAPEFVGNAFMPARPMGSQTLMAGEHPSGKPGKSTTSKTLTEAVPPPIAPSLPRTEMAIQQPVMAHKVHLEPICDVLFTSQHIFTVDYSGQVKVWIRPSASSSVEKVEATEELQSPR